MTLQKRHPPRKCALIRYLIYSCLDLGFQLSKNKRNRFFFFRQRTQSVVFCHSLHGLRKQQRKNYFSLPLIIKIQRDLNSSMVIRLESENSQCASNITQFTIGESSKHSLVPNFLTTFLIYRKEKKKRHELLDGISALYQPPPPSDLQAESQNWPLQIYCKLTHQLQRENRFPKTEGRSKCFH